MWKGNPLPLTTVGSHYFSPAFTSKYPLHLHSARAECPGAIAVSSIPLAEALGLGQVCQHRVLLPLQPVPCLCTPTAGVSVGLPDPWAREVPTATQQVAAGRRGASWAAWQGGCPGRVSFSVLWPALLRLLAGRAALWDGEKAVTGGGASDAGCHHVHGKAGLRRRARNGPGGQR